MADKKTATITHLAAARTATLADIAKLLERIKGIDAQLIELGPGRYQDETGEIVWQVIGKTEEKPGKVTYPPLPDAAAEEKARTLSGEHFNQLFDRIITHAPCEGFDLLAPKLLTPAKARNLVALCVVTGTATAAKAAYVKKG